MEIAPKSVYWRWVPALRLGGNRWLLLLGIIAVLLCIPLAVILFSVAPPYPEVWQHLGSTVLKDYIFNSLILVVGVACGTLVLGGSTAWLTAMCQFPGRKFFEWALLLPMAMPAYIIAYTYTGMMDVSGPIQSFLRESFDWRFGDYWFPEIRSLGGAICMFSLVLYPYVYLITRSAFLSQSKALLEVSRSMGKGPWQTLFQVAVPMARPALVAGVTLALMETLADYGTVQYFGISTFTTGIFRTWFGLGELRVAAQLSSLLLIFVFTLVVIERISRRHMRFHNSARTINPLTRVQLKPLNGLMSFLCCFFPVFFGFILPGFQLVLWLKLEWLDTDFLHLCLNSLSLAAMASVICGVLALGSCFSQRICRDSKLATSLVRMASLGYALPGTVIAIGVLIPLAVFDNQVDSWLEKHFQISSGLFLSGSVFALLFAYSVRFVAVSIHSIESGYSKLSPHMDDCARTLGSKPFNLLKSIHIPLLRSSILVALLLVFVDVLKELSATLILRPFNFNTLAVRAFELASDERLAEAAAPSLAIVVVGLIPVIVLSKAMSRKTSE